MVNPQRLPLLDIIVGDPRVVGSVTAVIRHFAYNRHGLDSNHTLQRQVCLVPTNVRHINTAGGTYANDPAKSSVEIWFAG